MRKKKENNISGIARHCKYVFTSTRRSHEAYHSKKSDYCGNINEFVKGHIGRSFGIDDFHLFTAPVCQVHIYVMKIVYHDPKSASIEFSVHQAIIEICNRKYKDFIAWKECIRP